MKIQRYVGKDMRSCLTQVRESLGPDAVILSSGKVGNEVEVVAAIDAEVAQAVASAPPAMHEPVRYEPPRTDMPRAEVRAPVTTRRASSQLSEAIAPPVSAAQMAPPPPAPVVTPGQDALASEMKDMRRMLEGQLATLAWNDLSRRSPLQA